MKRFHSAISATMVANIVSKAPEEVLFCEHYEFPLGSRPIITRHKNLDQYSSYQVHC